MLVALSTSNILKGVCIPCFFCASSSQSRETHEFKDEVFIILHLGRALSCICVHHIQVFIVVIHIWTNEAFHVLFARVSTMHTPLTLNSSLLDMSFLYMLNILTSMVMFPKVNYIRSFLQFIKALELVMNDLPKMIGT